MSALFRIIKFSAPAGVSLALAVLLFIPGLSVLIRAGESPTSLASMLRPVAERSTVFAKDGSKLAVLYAEQDRDPAKFDEVPAQFVNAIVDIEDRNFFDHAGLDLRSELRAFLANAKSGKIRQGGSTITQQLVKNALLTPERSLDRKLKEALLSLRLEGELSKKQILEQYLNRVYFGEGAYGVRAGAERFFGKSLGEITVPEAALLAGQIANPDGYNPFRRPQPALRRRREVLQRMVSQGHLDQDQANLAAIDPLPTTLHIVQPQPDTYFVEEVKRQLLRDERLGLTPQDRYQAVFGGGLRIHTTLDPSMQAAAERAVRTTLPKSPFTAAFVAVDVGTGAVRALVGGPGFQLSKYDLATQGLRQPGSSFKAITLAAALTDGYSINDTVDGTAPCLFKQGAGKPWRVENYEGSAGGVTSLRGATVHSLNCAYAQLAMALGPKKIVRMAKKLGITSPLDPVPSITLGSEEVSPLEMAGAFATFAADGVHHAPYFVNRVEDAKGRVIFKAHTDGSRVLDEEIARTETVVLRDVILGGTGTRANIGRPAAGKTGTSERNSDAWFVGYTPQLSAAVWMGSPSRRTPMPGVTGGSYPARIWASFMRAVLEGTPAADFIAPDPKRWPRARSVASVGRISVATTTSTLPGPPSSGPPTTGPPGAPPSTTPTIPGPAPSTTSPGTPGPPPPPTAGVGASFPAVLGLRGRPRVRRRMRQSL